METETAMLESLRSMDRKERERAEFAVFQQYHSRVRSILSRVLGSGAGLDDVVQEDRTSISLKGEGLTARGINPLFPALRPGPTAVSGAPAKSKFLAVKANS